MFLRTLAATIISVTPTFGLAAVLSFEADIIFEDYLGGPSPFSAPASYLHAELTIDPYDIPEIDAGSVATYDSDAHT